MELWYTQPAADWNAALPAGNGRLGCMQFGGVARERFQLNEDSLWSGGPMHRLNPDASATLPKVQELLRQGRLPDAERLALDGLASTPCGMRAYQPLGDLTLDFDGLPAEADDYCRGLDLDAGTLYVRFTVGGAHYAREAFASYPDGVFVLRLATDAPQGLSLRCRLDRKRREETGHLDNATTYFTGDSNGIGFTAAVLSMTAARRRPSAIRCCCAAQSRPPSCWLPPRPTARSNPCRPSPPALTPRPNRDILFLKGDMPKIFAIILIPAASPLPQTLPWNPCPPTNA